MTVYRVEKNRDYTTMANHHLRDERLSLRAKGLLSMLLGLPDDWEISIRGLSSIVRDGVASVQTGINELIDAGYIVRQRQHAEDGTFAGFEYIIHEKPPYTDSPYTENPYTVTPYTENCEQLNTKQSNTNQSIPPIVPQVGDDNPSVSGAAADSPTPLSAACGGISPRRGESALCTREPQSAETPKRKRRVTKSAPDYRPDTFARFWAAYPRGEDKQGAIAAWDELKPDDATLQAMSRALVRQKASEEWQRGIGIPYAVRWLRRRRWEDEIKTPAPPPESAGGDLPVWN